MSKLLENKQAIHIASEIVALLGLAFHFSQKNKRLMCHIEDLAHRVEEQENMLQTHERLIKQLQSVINNQSGQLEDPRSGFNSAGSVESSDFNRNTGSRNINRQPETISSKNSPVTRVAKQKEITPSNLSNNASQHRRMQKPNYVDDEQTPRSQTPRSQTPPRNRNERPCNKIIQVCDEPLTARSRSQISPGPSDHQMISFSDSECSANDHDETEQDLDEEIKSELNELVAQD